MIRLSIALFLTFTFISSEAQSDSISRQEMRIIQLENEVNDLNSELEKNQKHIKELLAENEKLSDSNFDKVDSRLTNFIWLISVIGGLIVASLTFFGWKYLSNSINTFFIERAKTLADKKLNSLITEEWLRSEVEKKSKTSIQKAVKNLQLDFLAISEQMIDDEKAKIQLEHERAQKTVKEIEKLRDELEKDGLDEKPINLTEENKKKIKKAASTPKSEKDFNWEDWLWKGIDEHAESKFQDALKSFSKALELSPKNKAVLAWLGDTEYDLKNYKKSIEYFNQSLLIDPNYVVALNNRGLSKIFNGDYLEAIRDFEAAIELENNSAIIYNNKGLANNYLENYEDAKMDLKKSLELNPDLVNAFTHLAYSNLMLNNIEEAKRLNEEAFKLDANFSRAHFTLGLIKHSEGKLKEACESWRKAFKLGLDEAQEKLDEFCNNI